MSKLRLTIISIIAVLIIPILFLGWLITTENGLNWAYRHAESYLPPELVFNKLKGRLIGPITITGLEYRQQGLDINAQQITIDWLATALLASNINISQLHIDSLSIMLPDTAGAKQPGTSLKKQAITLPEISLPWRLSLHDIEINNIKLTQDDRTISLNRLRLDASTLFSRVSIKDLSIENDSFSLAVKGKLRPAGDYKHELDINWQYTLPDNKIIRGQGRLAGNTKKTHLQQTLSGPLQLTLDTEFTHLLEQLDWKANADIRQFDLIQLDNGWPGLSGTGKLNASGDLETATLTGNMRGHYAELGALNADFKLQKAASNIVQIDQLRLLAPEKNTELNVSGLWTPGERGGDVKLALNWQNLRWPAQGTPWFDSAEGSGIIAGNIDDYRLSLDTDSPWPQTAPSTWHASASGNMEGMEIDSVRIKALNGEASVSGHLNWKKQVNWRAKGSFNKINPALRWPQWPGMLNGKVTSHGRVDNGKIIAEGEIQQLNGELRNYPVNLQSRLAWNRDHLDITELEYQAGQSRLHLSGRYGDTLGLNFKLDSNNLAELYPEAGGELHTTGTITGSLDSPVIASNFNGNKLSYPGLTVGTITGDITADLFRWRQLEIELIAKQLNIKTTRLLSLDIHTDGQRINTQLVTAKAQAQLVLQGKAQNQKAAAGAATTGWYGRIEQADVQSDYFDSWQLAKPVALAIRDRQLQLEDICWHSSRHASICASVQQQTALLARLTMDNAPLALFEHWLPADLTLNGTADATATIEYEFPEKLLAQLDITLPAGSINYPMLSGKENQRGFDAGKLQLNLDAQGLKASAELRMNNGDNFNASIRLPGYRPLAANTPEQPLPDQPLSASVRITAKDLRFIETFIHEIYDTQGELKLHLTASGTLDKPLISGDARIDNGAMQIPGLGLDIRQITMTGHSVASREFNFQLDAHSGDGKLNIKGHTIFDPDAGWPTDIFITGNDFEAARIPEARVTVTPDLRLNIANRTIDIKGSVLVPYAYLQPKDVSRAASVSSDTVIVNGGQAPEEKWLITSSVRVTLGDRVHFYGFGFEGRLGGSLLLEDEPGQLTRATGEITIPEGTYRAYGQRLDIENGRILYTGGPLTNPGVDIRAVRVVDNVTAGILVKGSLNNLQLEIYSSPAMSQTDALAYLLLGGPIENATNEDGEMLAKAALALGLSGGDTIARSLADRFGVDVMRIESSNKGDQAALVVGRYLSPKVYVSYGVGLIERVDTVTLRYQISKKWQLKIESGQSQGADMLYTIER